jgi:O-antigen/teichoic acid export membrane protein
MISASDMGRYVVALGLSRTLNSVYQASAAVLFPRCIGMTKSESFLTTVRMTVATTLVAVPVAAFLWLFGSSLLRLLYGADYVIATTLLQLLTAEAILSGVTTLMSQSFMAMGRPGTVTLLQTVGLAGTVPLLLFLVPRLGTVGAGVALLSTAVLRLFLLLGCYVWLAKRLPQMRDLRPLVGSVQADLRKLLAHFAGRPIEIVR